MFVSYDLIFVAKLGGQSWREALDAAPPVAGGHLDAAVWADVVAGVQEILGEITMHEPGWLTHRSTGIEVHAGSHRAAVTIPYWYTGADAEAIVEVLYQIGQVVASVTGMAGYDPQLELPLAQAQTQLASAVAVVDSAAQTLAEHSLMEYFHVCFTGDATLADAAQRLKKLIVAEDQTLLIVRWGDGPQMFITLATGPEVAGRAAELAQEHGVPEMDGHDRRFEVSFENLDEVLDEINTLIEVQSHLQDITGGYVVRSWNDEVTWPEDVF